MQMKWIPVITNPYIFMIYLAIIPLVHFKLENDTSWISLINCLNSMDIGLVGFHSSKQELIEFIHILPIRRADTRF